MEVRTVGDELVQRFGVSEDKVNKLVNLCEQAVVFSCAQIMSLPQDEASQMQAASGLDTQEWASLCICLGSVSSPHTFGPDPVVSALEGDAVASAQSLADPPPKDDWLYFIPNDKKSPKLRF